jgi:hypothetical protein
MFLNFCTITRFSLFPNGEFCKMSFLIFGKYGILIVLYVGGGVRGGNMGVELWMEGNGVRSKYCHVTAIFSND